MKKGFQSKLPGMSVMCFGAGEGRDLFNIPFLEVLTSLYFTRIWTILV